MKAQYTFCMMLICLTLASVAVAGGHSSTAASGQTVFETNCAKCHDSFIGGFTSGAPALGDQADWAVSVPKGVDGLTETTIAGIGEMKARGGCAACSDEEIRAAVEYILEQNQ
jgi:cytochrome c5